MWSDDVSIMKFPYYLFPKTQFEITTSKDILAIEKSIYQETILKETDTRIDMSERDDVNRVYLFNIEREFILFRTQDSGSVKGCVQGVIQTHQKNNKSYSAVIIKSRSLSLLILTGFFWLGFLSKIYGDVSSDKFTSVNAVIVNLLLVVIFIGVRAFLFSKIRRQIAIVKDEVELSFR